MSMVFNRAINIAGYIRHTTPVRKRPNFLPSYHSPLAKTVTTHSPRPSETATADAETIHDVATGEAAKVVAKHQDVPSQDDQMVTFYAGWFCPFVQRVWISLEETGIPYQYKEVNPYKKEPHFLAINPKGLVPALEYKGVALNESLILCQFVNDLTSSIPSKRSLLPSASTDPIQRAQSLIWIDHLVKNVIAPFQRLVQAQTKEEQDAEREELYKGLRKFVDGDEVSGGVKGPYWAGDEFSLVDIAIASWIVRDWVIARHRGYKREDVSEKWKKYAEEVEKRPSVASTLSDRDRYMPLFQRHLKDEWQGEVAKAARAGRDIS